MSKLKTITLELDELDYDAVQRAMARRQNFCRSLPGVTEGIYPDGDSNLAGLLVAEICRGWEELLDYSHPKGDH